MRKGFALEWVMNQGPRCFWNAPVRWLRITVSGISLRNAALVAGIHEVAAALEARGIYP